jgi:hypothetical protein
MLFELGQTLCATVAGGCGQAEALSEHREVLFERMELRNRSASLSRAGERLRRLARWALFTSRAG